MTRIIAGKYGGRQIKTPKGDGTRPTSDRVREALFSSLESELGGFDGVLGVLDLFAGSGALGFEAMSRGASSVEFVESDRRAAEIIRENRALLGVRAARIQNMTVEAFLRKEIHGSYDLVFIDPPYALPTQAVAGIVAGVNDLYPDALFVVERATRDPFVWPEGVEGLRSKKYGETTLWYGR